MAGGSDGLGQALARVVFLVEPLALEVAPLHVVAVDQDQLADTRPGQRAGLEMRPMLRSPLWLRTLCE